ncbi:DnaD domain protein [Aneurinibacillus terranovensis]|uniref:DnaD domain protein n=1 Tax=Aneurinibacillus terranovensis TaxID=278991 RepID=UPI0004038D3B|nr:DnaD domain protein [Aneurinibacillus terranovensis]
MNYIKELNAFTNWLETNPLDATTQCLWFHLMSINNKCGWSEWFTVANLTLQAKLSISERSLQKYRNTLVQKGRIEYKKQGTQKAGKYRIIPFEAETKEQAKTKLTAKFSVKYTVKRTVKCSAKYAVKCSTLIKHKQKHKQKEKQQQKQQKKAPVQKKMTAYELYQNTIRIFPSLPEQAALEKWITVLGDDFVYKAIEECCKSADKAPNFRLLEKMINDWVSQGARTVEDIDRLQAAFRNKNLTVIKGGTVHGTTGKSLGSSMAESEPTEKHGGYPSGAGDTSIAKGRTGRLHKPSYL